jgi:hypothetical protein
MDRFLLLGDTASTWSLDAVLLGVFIAFTGALVILYSENQKMRRENRDATRVCALGLIIIGALIFFSDLGGRTTTPAHEANDPSAPIPVVQVLD